MRPEQQALLARADKTFQRNFKHYKNQYSTFVAYITRTSKVVLVGYTPDQELGFEYVAGMGYQVTGGTMLTYSMYKHPYLSGKDLVVYEVTPVGAVFRVDVKCIQIIS